MPIQVQGPDGQQFEFPDGTDQNVMRSAMQKHYGAPKSPSGIDPMFANVPSGSLTGTNMTPQEARGKNVRGFTPMLSPQDRADAQAYGRYQERVDRAKLHSVLGAIGDGISGAYHAVTGAADSLFSSSGEAQQREADYRSQMGDSTGAKVGDLAGNVAMYALPAAKVGALTKGGGLLAKLVAQGGVGAAQGALQPVVDGESRLGNAEMGAAFGAGGQAVGSTLGTSASRAANAVPGIKREMAAVAGRYGIPLHVAQLTDSLPAKLAASASKYLPFSGAAQAAERQQGAWNDALSQAMGNQPGIARPLSDEAMQATKRRIGGLYNDVYSRNSVDLDPDTLRAMTGIANEATQNIEAGGAKVVGNQLDRIIDNFGDGPITGAKYQSLRGQLDKAAKANPGTVGDQIKGLRRLLDQAAGQSVGADDAATLKSANSQYANMKTVEKALQQAGGAGENVAPGNLWNLVRNGSTQDMRDLARLGKTVLQDQIPDSGTAGRNLFYGALGAGGGMAPFTHGATLAVPLAQLAGGATVGRALNSPALARLMLRENPGALRRLIGEQLLPYGTAGLIPLQAQGSNQPNNGP